MWRKRSEGRVRERFPAELAMSVARALSRWRPNKGILSIFKLYGECCKLNYKYALPTEFYKLYCHDRVGVIFAQLRVRTFL